MAIKGVEAKITEGNLSKNGVKSYCQKIFRIFIFCRIFC